jgi:hypothetical protein
LVSESLQGTIIGGIIGFGSGIGVDLIKTWIRRPKISISEQTLEVDIEPWPQITKESWTSTRIKVENNGSTAAEDCKAYLITERGEFRIAWVIAKDDRTVIINAHDAEYIDLCAIRQITSDSTTTYYRIFTTERGYGSSIQECRIFEGDINAKLKVSAKNAKQCIRSVRIRRIPVKGFKVVEFQ